MLNTLNKEQKQAVLSDDSALLILAGAGSGKTRVLTSKIAYLLQEKNVSPYSVLAFTFTNKAASEMKERVSKALGRPVDDMWIGTFHSICSKILRFDIKALGYTSNFTIYDSSDQKTLIKQIIKELAISDEALTPQLVLSHISKANNKGVTVEQYAENARSEMEKHIAWVFKHYQEEKKKNNALDFDDLILKTLELFNNKDILEAYRNKFKYIFVDEYQDTNRPQYELIRKIAGNGNNITVVGDADQSIYGWRGADIQNILDFEKDFPHAKTILLEQNYRSTKKILNAANELIVNNNQRMDKNLWTENSEGTDVTFTSFQNEYDEARRIVQWIEQEKYRGKSYSDMCILYRTNAQSRAFEEQLIQEGITYQVVGGLKFYDRAEIKDLIAYMNLAVNSTDDISFRRIVNQPKRGIGNASIETLKKLADGYGVSLMDALREKEIFNKLSSSQQGKFGPFLEIINSLRDSAEGSISEFARKVYSESGYKHMLETSVMIEDKSRIENIDAFFSAIDEYEENTEEAGVMEYLQTLALLSDLDKTENSKNGVKLMTIHSAKGLEFPVVFIAGLEDGLFPSRMAIEEGNLEEERRLFYVAITRAEEKLYLTQASTRRQYGQVQIQKTSRFLDELGDSIVYENRHQARDDEGYNSFSSASSNSGAGSFFGSDSSNGYNTSKNTHFMNKGFTDPTLRKEYDEKRMKMRELIKKKQEKQAETLTTSFRVGDRVKHKKFGEGMIVSVAARADGDELTVAFDSKGLKRLNAKIAPINKLN